MRSFPSKITHKLVKLKADKAKDSSYFVSYIAAVLPKWKENWLKVVKNGRLWGELTRLADVAWRSGGRLVLG